MKHHAKIATFKKGPLSSDAFRTAMLLQFVVLASQKRSYYQV